MENQLVFSQEGNLYLNTSMTQGAFTKSRLVQHMNEAGCIATLTQDGWSFEPWSFVGTATRECTDESLSMAARNAAETVLLEGKAFDGCTLKNYIDAAEKAQVAFAGALICTIIEAALDQNKPLPSVGAGAIFISNDFKSVIFLPHDLFETSMLCAGKDAYTEYEGLYVNRVLEGNAALQFTQAVLAYRLLCGEFPFAEADTQAREEDLLDANYVPVTKKIWALSEKLGSCIDNALQRKAGLKGSGHKTASGMITEGAKPQQEALHASLRAGMRFPLQELYRETGLTESGAIPSDGTLAAVIHKASVPREQFEADSGRYLERSARRIARRRFLRHNRTKLSICAAAAVTIVLLASVYINGIMHNPTTKGLSAEETVQMFYSAVNGLDVTAAQESSRGKHARTLVDMISNIYVSSKSQSMYDIKAKTVSPAAWFNDNNDGSYHIYGLTQFSIQDNKSSLFFEAPIKNTWPKPYEIQDGETLRSGSTRTLHASYYLVYTEGEDDLSFFSCNDTVTLTFKGNRWLITDIIKDNGESASVSYTQFAADFRRLLAENGENLVLTANAMRGLYGWIPANSEILEYKNEKEGSENCNF